MKSSSSIGYNITLASCLSGSPRRDVTLISVTESLDTGSAAGRLVLDIMTANCRSSGAQLYCSMVPRECIVLVEDDPSEPVVLAEIRELRREDATLRGIAAALNHRSYRTRRGTPWRLESVARTLRLCSNA